MRDQEIRAALEHEKRFVVRRIMCHGYLWVTEYILTYDGKPSYTVSSMEFRARRLQPRCVAAD
jgi:hypothetical protein